MDRKEETDLIKGIQRRMVLVRTPDSKIFEEAHLVLRAEPAAVPPTEGDMLKEATRIIESADIRTEARGKRGHRRRLGGGVGLLLGGLLGGGAVGALWLFLSFL